MREVGDADENEPAGVGRTAIGVARIRAAETQRPDALFRDPCAQWFADATRWTPPESREEADGTYGPFWRRIVEGVIVRTRFLDDYVLAAAHAGCAQVVILGAGLDARAYRLDWPDGVRLYELDTTDVLGFKDRVLDAHAARPACERIAVPCDLREDWPAAIRAAGLNPGEPTAWIAEGLLIYLTAEDNERILARIGGLSAPGSRLGVTLSGYDPTATDGAGDRAPGEFVPGRARPRVTELWRSAGPGDPAAWLDGHGWDATVYESAERAAAYGRPMRSANVRPRHLVDAVRR